MIFFILNMICYANAACDSLIKSICYHEAKRGRWDFGITGRVKEACGFVIRHHFAHCHTARGSVCALCLVWLPSSLPPPPAAAPTRSQSGFTIVGPRWRLRTRSALELNLRDPLPLLPFGLGAQCEAAATQARLSQLMQKKEKSFGKVTIYHRCTLPRSALSAAPKPFCSSAAFVSFEKLRNIVVTALKDCCLNQLILLGATNIATFFANHPCVAAKTQPQKAGA